MFEYNSPLTRAAQNINQGIQSGQQAQLMDMQLTEAKRQADDRAALRQQLASAQPETTGTITPAAPTQELASDRLGLAAAPGAQYLPNPLKPPTPAPLTGSLESEMQNNGLAEKPAPDASGFNIPQEPVSDSVQAMQDGRLNIKTTQPNYAGIALQHYMSTGNLEAANVLKQQIVAQAKSVTDVSGNANDGLKIMNEALGTNYSVMKTPAFQLMKNGDEVTGILDEGTMKTDMLKGMSLSDAMHKNLVPVSLGGASPIVSKFLAETPNPTAQQVWDLANKNGIPLKTIEPIITRIQASQNEQGRFDRQQKQQEHSDARFAATLAAKNSGAGSNMGGGAQGPLNAQGVNEGALQGLSPSMAAYVKKVANYEIPIPNPRSKEGIALAGRVALFDPTYDTQQYPLRQAVRKSFTSGKDAANITSLNTAIHHLDQLDKSVDELNNSWSPKWNAIANTWESSFMGDPKFKKVINDLNAVKGEMSTTFKGTGATDQEIKAWDKGFDVNGSPAQLKEAGVQEGVKLLQGRLDALIDKYQTGMGKSIDIQILSPKSLTSLEKLGVNVDRYKAIATTSNNPTASGQTAPSDGRPSLESIFKRGYNGSHLRPNTDSTTGRIF